MFFFGCNPNLLLALFWNALNPDKNKPHIQFPIESLTPFIKTQSHLNIQPLNKLIDILLYIKKQFSTEVALIPSNLIPSFISQITKSLFHVISFLKFLKSSPSPKYPFYNTPINLFVLARCRRRRGLGLGLRRCCWLYRLLGC